MKTIEYVNQKGKIGSKFKTANSMFMRLKIKQFVRYEQKYNKRQPETQLWRILLSGFGVKVDRCVGPSGVGGVGGGWSGVGLQVQGIVCYMAKEFLWPTQ